MEYVCAACGKTMRGESSLVCGRCGATVCKSCAKRGCKCRGTLMFGQ